MRAYRSLGQSVYLVGMVSNLLPPLGSFPKSALAVPVYSFEKTIVKPFLLNKFSTFINFFPMSDSDNKNYEGIVCNSTDDPVVSDSVPP